MSKAATFKDVINSGYTFKGDSITLGGAMLDGEPIAGTHVKVPLKTLNRHGLIQLLLEQEKQNPFKLSLNNYR